MRLANKRADRPLQSLWPLLRGALGTVWSAARRPFLGVVALTVATALLAVGQILAARELLTELLADPDDVRVGALAPPALLIAGLTAASLAVNGVIGQVQRLLGELVMRDTHRRMLDVTTGVPLETYETPWFFNYVVRVETNALTKPLDLVQAVVSILTGGAVALGVSCYLFTVDPLLPPLLLVFALPLFLVNRLGSKREFDFAVEHSAGLRDRMYLSTVLKGRDTAKEVRAFELAPLLRGRWEDRYATHVTGLRGLVARRAWLAVLAAAASGAVLLATMLFLLWRVDTGHVPLAEAGAALVAIRMLTGQLQTTANGSTRLYEARLFLSDLEDFLSLGGVLNDPSPKPRAGLPIPRRGFDRITLEQVGYRYPGSDRDALQDISLSIDRGEVIALVGENGSGKTTLAKLLAGLHRPVEGSVRWDGIPLEDYDPEEVRRRIAVTFQDFARYELSVLENIAVGRALDAVDPESARSAAMLAGAASFVESLPRGYDTVLSKAVAGGADLSLGQWQRIALARAIYRDARFIVLDEPTSALDPRAERELFARMREMFAGRTVLLISHRFSSVRHADRIHVLDAGRIVEAGSHDDLMARGGLYSELFTLQAAAYQMS